MSISGKEDMDDYLRGFRAGKNKKSAAIDPTDAQRYLPTQNPQNVADIPSLGPDGFSLDYAAMNGEGAGSTPSTERNLVSQLTNDGPVWTETPMPQAAQFGFHNTAQPVQARTAAGTKYPHMVMSPNGGSSVEGTSGFHVRMHEGPGDHFAVGWWPTKEKAAENAAGYAKGYAQGHRMRTAPALHDSDTPVDWDGNSTHTASRRTSAVGEGITAQPYPNPDYFDGQPHGLQGPPQFPVNPSADIEPVADTPLHWGYDANGRPPVSPGSAQGTVPAPQFDKRQSSFRPFLAQLTGDSLDHSTRTQLQRGQLWTVAGWTDPDTTGTSWAQVPMADGRVHHVHPDLVRFVEHTGRRHPFGERTAAGGGVRTAKTDGKIVGICDNCGTAVRYHTDENGTDELRHLHNNHRKCNGPSGAGKKAHASVHEAVDHDRDHYTDISTPDRGVECPNCKGNGYINQFFGPAVCSLCNGAQRVPRQVRTDFRHRTQAAALERPSATNPTGRGSDPFAAKTWDNAARQRPTQSLEDLNPNTPSDPPEPIPVLDTNRPSKGQDDDDDDDDRRTASRKENAMQTVAVACGRCGFPGQVTMQAIAVRGVPACPRCNSSDVDFADAIAARTANSGGTGWTQPMPDPLANSSSYPGPGVGNNPLVGAELDANPRICPTCHGTGQMQDSSDGTPFCRTCWGKGYLTPSTAPGATGAPRDATTRTIHPGGASSTTAAGERRFFADHPSGYRAEYHGGPRVHIYEGDVPVASPTINGYSDAMSSGEVHDLASRMTQRRTQQHLDRWVKENGVEQSGFDHPDMEMSYGDRARMRNLDVYGSRTAGRTSTADPYGTAEYQNTHGGFRNNGPDGYRQLSVEPPSDDGIGVPVSRTVKERQDRSYSHGNQPYQLDEADCPECGHMPTQLVRDRKDNAWWHCPNCGSLANIDKSPQVNPYAPQSDFQPDRSMKRAGRLFRLARNEDDNSELFALLDLLLRNNPGAGSRFAVTAARQGLLKRRS